MKALNRDAVTVFDQIGCYAGTMTEYRMRALFKVYTQASACPERKDMSFAEAVHGLLTLVNPPPDEASTIEALKWVLTAARCNQPVCNVLIIRDFGEHHSIHRILQDSEYAHELCSFQQGTMRLGPPGHWRNRRPGGTTLKFGIRIVLVLQLKGVTNISTRLSCRP